MKKIILLIALVAAPLVSYGQSMFDSLEDMKGVSSVIINKDAFEILSKFNIKTEDSEAMQVFKMIQDLNELKVYSTTKSDVADTMSSMVSKAIKGSNLVELMRIKEEDSQVKIYVKASSNKDFVSEVLMYAKGIDKHTDKQAESVIVSLTGNIDINKLSKIADTFTKDAKIKVSKN